MVDLLICRCSDGWRIVTAGDEISMVPLIWNVLFMFSFHLSKLTELRPLNHGPRHVARGGYENKCFCFIPEQFLNLNRAFERVA